MHCGLQEASPTGKILPAKDRLSKEGRQLDRIFLQAKGYETSCQHP
jgi:hypothetical protein